jgi:hypothetical protein
MEHPARCGVLHRLALLMRKRGVLRLEGGAHTLR